MPPLIILSMLQGKSKTLMGTNFQQVVNGSADERLPIVEIPCQSKLSCLSWNKYTKNHIASSDFEGIVTIWDINTQHVASVSFYVLQNFDVIIVYLYAFSAFDLVFRALLNMKNMKSEFGVLIFHVQNHQCLHLVVMITRYGSNFHFFFIFYFVRKLILMVSI